MKPNASRAQAALILIWIIFGLDLLLLISSFMQYNLIQNIVAGNNVSESDIAWNDLREKVLGVAYLITFIISIITFIRWFRRAYGNLEAAGYNTSYSEGWAAGSWFVPFVNWVMPYKIMRELYQGSHSILPETQARETLSKGARMLPFWWLLWVVNIILGYVVYHLSQSIMDVETIQKVTLLSLLIHIVGLLLCLLTVGVIRNYAKAESLLTAEELPSYKDYVPAVSELYPPADGAQQ